MSKYASEIVKLAQSWVGIKEGSAGHKEILDIYNSQKPLPRGYKMTMKDSWCAATTTALAVKLGYTDIIPCECSCNKLIEIAKKMGIWIENESITPKPGMFCLYDWDDDGKGDNVGRVEHVGVVETVSGGQFVVIEGNADTNRDGKDGVERRHLSVNAKYLRGFISPKYDEEVVEPELLEVDGKWGKATTTRLQKIFGTKVDGEISNQWEKYKEANPGLVSGWEWQKKPNGRGSSLIKAMQKWAGMPVFSRDGEIGPKTIKAFQKKLGTTQDGKVSNPSQMVKALQKWANTK